ncbi:MAG: flagellin FliC [Rhodoferax sp.]|jgi:flagellin|uniref:flagellin N-terminal helical domain-containing protein n=1 Tax=Rhodoferax sp. TaxID=50421 RepID=UPI0018170912|nr:flagellin [Rhodoferax sp.]NMM15480.1 flagellin FliC [Rhodoferax sp.]NMM20324.1 flagellin FliC [Rhodoferax sp.]
MSTINTNINSLNAQRNLAGSANTLSTSMARLSSGLRVNSAKDDAAGLAIAERMNAQTRGMNVAIRNANDGISLAQTAEGALGAISNNLQRMRELAVQAANGTNNSTDITAINAEFTLLSAENTRVAAATSFNGTAVIAATTFTFQVGANNTANDTISVTGSAFTATSTTLGATSSSASAEISKLDTDINAVTSARSTWGATQNRFDSVITNLRVGSENSAAARGRIMDADYAMETANLSRAQVLQQAGTAMVAQANQQPQSVLALLK